MKCLHYKKIAITAAILTSSTVANLCNAAANDIAFVFGPAPVAKAIEKGSNSQRIGINTVDISADAMDLTGFGVQFTSRERLEQGRIGTRGSFGINVMENIESTPEISILTLDGLYDLEFYPVNDDFIIFTGLGFGITDMEMTINSGSAETNILNFGTTITIRGGLQNHFSLSPSVGMTPYILFTSSTISQDSDVTTDFNPCTILCTTTSSTSSSISTSGTTIGFDMDFNGVSLSAMINNSDDTTVTMFTLGKDF